MPIEMIEEFDQGTQIKVIGVGGGGGNAVEHMIGQGVQGVDFICANTDAQALNRSNARSLVQLGTSGLGAGSKPDVGRSSAEDAVEKIREEAIEFAMEASSGGRTEEELGDLLFSIVNAARFLAVSPELALRRSVREFAGRFREMEGLAREQGRHLSHMTLAEMEALWEEAKAREVDRC